MIWARVRSVTLGLLLLCSLAAGLFEVRRYIQSSGARGWFGAVAAFVLLLVLQGLLQYQANKSATPKLTFFDLIVTGEDNRYSLTRLQIYLWTVATVVAFVQIASATGALPTIPSSLGLLMGISGLTTTISTAVTDFGKLANNKASEPSFYRDIFLDSHGTLDLPRVQMFVWTVVILGAYMAVFWRKCLAGHPVLDPVDPGLLVLMGVSNGAYLGVKAALEKKP